MRRLEGGRESAEATRESFTTKHSSTGLIQPECLARLLPWKNLLRWPVRVSLTLNHRHNAPGNFSPEEETEEKEWKPWPHPEPIWPCSSPEKLASPPGGLCTTGLQDRDVSTMAAIISSISTASDFLDSDG